MDLLPFAKLTVHFVIPILFTTLLMGLTLSRAIKGPFTFRRTTLKKALQLGTFVVFMAMTAIFGGHVIFSQLVDSTAIAGNPSDYGVDKTIFLWLLYGSFL